MFFPARGDGLAMLFCGLVVPAMAPEVGVLPAFIAEELAMPELPMLELPMLELLFVPAVGEGLTALFCGLVVPAGSLAEEGACAIAIPLASSKAASGIALTSVLLNMKNPLHPGGLIKNKLAKFINRAKAEANLKLSHGVFYRKDSPQHVGRLPCKKISSRATGSKFASVLQWRFGRPPNNQRATFQFWYCSNVFL